MFPWREWRINHWLSFSFSIVISGILVIWAISFFDSWLLKGVVLVFSPLFALLVFFGIARFAANYIESYNGVAYVAKSYPRI